MQFTKSDLKYFIDNIYNEKLLKIIGNINNDVIFTEDI